MANIKSNAKSAERARAARTVHKAEKSYLRNRIKEAKATGNSDKVNLAFKALDSKASKGLIKKSTANRLKSRLAKHVNKMNSPQNNNQ
ncbi:small subunit ribosomal protein S20 [Mycoplasmoides fastidiosum]|uniref:Small ribosomal subunit protein bS20 n=1 Tax=Mycoplasmoides fastidiosum TaxID=92758 RepID=A0ABU0LY78_9BACT|nr:30S ribosomal protein S20 [Mycoplasmoides fastidiosum]MDQ0513667.1 small subunit ribosomal protein S20 [Mycoplasmoides fastidiosum]UUD37914.1 30S ribosomal protein S20 [Mycoplasmoides fastidiosum]